jgi:hypothetical protein
MTDQTLIAQTMSCVQKPWSFGNELLRISMTPPRFFVATLICDEF